MPAILRVEPHEWKLYAIEISKAFAFYEIPEARGLIVSILLAQHRTIVGMHKSFRIKIAACPKSMNVRGIGAHLGVHQVNLHWCRPA